MVEKRRKMELLKQHAVQCIVGFTLVAGSIMAVIAGWTYDICTQSKDGTILLLTVPLGLYMMFAKDLCYNQ